MTGNDARRARFAADVACESEVQRFVASALDGTDAPAKTRLDLCLALEELFVNVASYAYAPNAGAVDMEVRVDAEGRRIAVTLIDEGAAFDPFSRPDPTAPKSIEEAPIGGLGIKLVKSLMDSCSYERADGRNVVTVEKGWEAPAEDGSPAQIGAMATRGGCDGR